MECEGKLDPIVAQAVRDLDLREDILRKCPPWYTRMRTPPRAVEALYTRGRLRAVGNEVFTRTG